MKVTFFGTTTLLFDDGKDQILFDCHFTRPSLMRYIFGRASTDTDIVDEMLKKHHIDRLKAIMDAPYVANRTGAVIYGTSSAMNVARGGGVKEKQLIEFRQNETYEIGDYKIKVLKSLHSKPTIINNDLGQTIDEPLPVNAKLRDYKEGGSYDFYIEHRDKKILIRPSFNYILGQLDGIHADVLFLGVAGLAKASPEMEKIFFAETVEKRWKALQSKRNESRQGSISTS